MKQALELYRFPSEIVSLIVEILVHADDFQTIKTLSHLKDHMIQQALNEHILTVLFDNQQKDLTEEMQQLARENMISENGIILSSLDDNKYFQHRIWNYLRNVKHKACKNPRSGYRTDDYGYTDQQVKKLKKFKMVIAEIYGSFDSCCGCDLNIATIGLGRFVFNTNYNPSSLPYGALRDIKRALFKVDEAMVPDIYYHVQVHKPIRHSLVGSSVLNRRKYKYLFASKPKTESIFDKIDKVGVKEELIDGNEELSIECQHISKKFEHKVYGNLVDGLLYRKNLTGQYTTTVDNPYPYLKTIDFFIYMSHDPKRCITEINGDYGEKHVEDIETLNETLNEVLVRYSYQIKPLAGTMRQKLRYCINRLVLRPETASKHKTTLISQLLMNYTAMCKQRTQPSHTDQAFYLAKLRLFEHQ